MVLCSCQSKFQAVQKLMVVKFTFYIVITVSTGFYPKYFLLVRCHFSGTVAGLGW